MEKFKEGAKNFAKGIGYILVGGLLIYGGVSVLSQQVSVNALGVIGSAETNHLVAETSSFVFNITNNPHYLAG